MPKEAVIRIGLGLGDESTSMGMEELHDVIAKLGSNLHVPPPFDFYNWDTQVVPELKTYPADWLRILIGYSMSGNAVTWIAGGHLFSAVRYMGPIDLIVGYDPSITVPPWWQCTPLGPNVRRAICYHNTNPLNPVGHASYSAGPGFDPRRLTTYTTTDMHMAVDYDQKLHDITIGAIKARCGMS